MYYVYSLKCKDGYYIGCTDNLKDRLESIEKAIFKVYEEEQLEEESALMNIRVIKTDE